MNYNDLCEEIARRETRKGRDLDISAIKGVVTCMFEVLVDEGSAETVEKNSKLGVVDDGLYVALKLLKYYHKKREKKAKKGGRKNERK